MGPFQGIHSYMDTRVWVSRYGPPKEDIYEHSLRIAIATSRAREYIYIEGWRWPARRATSHPPIDASSYHGHSPVVAYFDVFCRLPPNRVGTGGSLDPSSPHLTCPPPAWLGLASPDLPGDLARTCPKGGQKRSSKGPQKRVIWTPKREAKSTLSSMVFQGLGEHLDTLLGPEEGWHGIPCPLFEGEEHPSMVP
jgi:hypothetical protein